MDDFSEMAQIYEGYRGHTDNMTRKNFRGVPPRVDYKNSYMPRGVANSGGADNSFAANMMSNAGMIENEEGPSPRAHLEEYVEELRARGQEGIANELALVVQQAFEGEFGDSQ